MLSKPHRLPAVRIPHVLRFGKRTANELLQLVAAKGEANVSKFAVIISTKVDKRATQRNRMRRLLSESVRLGVNGIPPGFDYIFIVKKPFAEKNIHEIEKKVASLFQTSGITT